MGITFAAFYIKIAPHTHDLIQTLVPTFRLDEPLSLMKTMFKSAERTHPGCRKVVLTDHKTDFTGLPEDIEICRYALDPHLLTLSRTTAQAHYLKDCSDEDDLVFLDADILIQKSLDPIFFCDFDVGLTYRHHSLPINTGVIFIHRKAQEKSLEFIEELLRLMRKQNIEYQTWFGSQIVLREEWDIPEKLKRDSRFFVREVWGAKVMLVPANLYNFSTSDELMNGHYPGKYILHFKGKRKVFIQSYFDRYMNLSD